MTEQLLQVNSTHTQSTGGPWNTAGARQSISSLSFPVALTTMRESGMLLMQKRFQLPTSHSSLENKCVRQRKWVRHKENGLNYCLPAFPFPHFLPSILNSWLSGGARSKSHILRYSCQLSMWSTLQGWVTFQTWTWLMRRDSKTSEQEKRGATN